MLAPTLLVVSTQSPIKWMTRQPSSSPSSSPLLYLWSSLHPSMTAVSSCVCLPRSRGSRASTLMVSPYHQLLLFLLFFLFFQWGAPFMLQLPRSTARLSSSLGRRWLSMRAMVDVGDWVVLHESGRVARVVNSQSKGWWALEDYKTTHTFSARSGTFSRLRTPPPDAASSMATTTTTVPNVQVLNAEDYPRHACTTSWVVFSDLHVSLQSLPVCLEVLRKVHEEAKVRDAGIIFLGDFWHNTVTLRAEVLNEVFDSLRRWTQPVIMLPGNHDQVTMDGTVHALTFIKYAFRSFDRQAVVLTEPAVFLRALWLPYARDPTHSVGILRSIGKVPPLSGIQSIFCHADIAGASMNGNTLSLRGLSPQIFPKSLPTFSGHFHKPHSLRGGTITYVGSPYQTTLSEAGQSKRLLLLQGGQRVEWSEEDNIGLDIGKRYFRVTSLAEAESLMDTSSLSSGPRPGDRVVMMVSDTTDPHSLSLRDRLQQDLGVEVELRQRLLPSSQLMEEDLLGPGVVDYEALGPLQVLQSYFETEVDVDPAVVDEGMKLVEQYMKGPGGTAQGLVNTGAQSRARKGPTRLVLQELRLRGYGPYREEVSYPLDQRGLVLLTGKNLDDSAADSNAAGKSKLAMAPLWALTGEADPRPVMDGRVHDVVFNITGSTSGRKAQSSFAEVSVVGTVNGAQFKVTRRRGPSSNQLHFMYDGQDLTRQGTRETQRLIEETLGIDASFLSLAVFCGQHGMRGLLESTDVELKERLAQVVVMDHWHNLVNIAKDRLRSLLEKASSIDTQIYLRESDLGKEQLQRGRLVEEVRRLQEDVVRRRQDAGIVESDALQQLEGSVRKALEELEALDKERWQAREKKEQELRGIREARGEALEIRAGLKARLDMEESERGKTKRRVEELERRYDSQRYARQLSDALELLEPAGLSSEGMDAAAGIPLQVLEEKMKVVEVKYLKSVAECQSLEGEKAKLKDMLASFDQLSSLGYSVMNSNAATSTPPHGGTCPLCGHDWSSDEHREHRVAALQEELTSIKTALTRKGEEKRELEAELRENERRLAFHRDYLRDVSEWRTLQEDLASRCSQQDNLRASLDQAMKQAQELEGEYSRVERQWGQRLEATEMESNRKRAEYEKLQQDLPRMLALSKDVETAERLQKAGEMRLEEKEAEIRQLQAGLDKSRRDREVTQSKSRVYRELQDHLGVRGVQTFVYRGAATQLERLANYYMTLIADGNLLIKLSLEGERISKEVLISGADGAYHNRSLSQLSGGQWRRASLAMLLAFRELSRLRSGVDCNILVLDEVLNHLDAEGRRRVGQVLKMMCKGESEAPIENANLGMKTRDELVSNGGVNTILVILQDLAAMELQDVFNKNDEVVKRGDISTVNIDVSDDLRGGHEDVWMMPNGGDEEERSATITATSPALSV